MRSCTASWRACIALGQAKGWHSQARSFLRPAAVTQWSMLAARPPRGSPSVLSSTCVPVAVRPHMMSLQLHPANAPHSLKGRYASVIQATAGLKFVTE